MALTRPSLQLDFCSGAFGFPGLSGFAQRSLDGEPSSFASTLGFGLTRLFGCPAYWPDNQDRLPVFAAASKPFWRVDTGFFYNSVDY
jgi:hypothetical protein